MYLGIWTVQGLQVRYYLILYSIMSVDNDAAAASKGYIGIEKKLPGFPGSFFNYSLASSFSSASPSKSSKFRSKPPNISPISAALSPLNRDINNMV